MKPTMDDVDKYWWLKNGDDTPEVVRIEYNKYKKCLVAWFTGWEIDYPVDEYKEEYWLCEAKPPTE